MSARVDHSLHQMPVRRRPLPEGAGEAVAESLQRVLVDLIDFALQAKQAHWNLVGPNFRSFHLELDEIIATVRDASDDTAERIVAIGFAADGRAATIAATTVIDRFPEGDVSVEEAIHLIADRLAGVTTRLREAINQVNDRDPISGDLLIQTARALEKHLWMVQSQES